MKSLILSNEILGKENSTYNKREHLINNYRMYLEKFGIEKNYTVLVHGSYATGEVNEFSDIDVIFIKKNNFNNIPLLIEKEILKKATLFLHHHDPLMHHGVDILEEKIFINKYDESIFPINTIKKSVVILGERELDVNPDIDKSVFNAKNKLIALCSNINRIDSRVVSRTPYKVKCLISMVLLAPVLLLQAIDELFLYKRDALAIFKDRYRNILSLNAVEEAERRRKNWKLHKYAKITRKMLNIFEDKVNDLLILQRIAGIYRPYNAIDYSYLFEESRLFAQQIMRLINDYNR